MLGIHVRNACLYIGACSVIPKVLMRDRLRRIRQKPKVEIVLTKSAEFDTIVAEENEPNAAESGEYDGKRMFHTIPSPCTFPAHPTAHGGPVRTLSGSKAAA